MKTLVEAILRLSNMASDDVLRMTINGVGFDSHDGKLRLRATDGYAFTEELIETNLDIGRGTILMESMPQLKAFLKSLNRHVHDVDVRRVDNSLNFSAAGASVTINVCDVEFPDTERVKVRDTKGYVQVSFNPHILMALYKAMNTEKKDETVTLFIDPYNSCVKGDSKGTLSAIVVEHADRAGVLMPIRKQAKGSDK